jgi:serine/threonine-protein kinase
LASSEDIRDTLAGGKRRYDPSEPIFPIGEHIGRVYEIKRVLGGGGMGQVLEAHDHALDRRVAIKAAWPDLDLPPLREEARAMAALRHPSLVTVHALGVHRGIDYIVMERIYGVSLGALLDQRLANEQPFSWRESAQILMKVAEGLAVVHGAGIAHRDVKPGNVMLTPDDRVVLVDFGLFLPEVQMVRADFVAGSPPYMSSEALTGEVEPGSGPLIDLYALGVSAFELLTGRLPRKAATLPELYELHKEPPPDVRSWRRDVPSSLAELILEMMATEAGHRPASAEAIVWRLRAILEDRSSKAPPPVRRVLIVEDDDALRKLLSFHVKRTLGPGVEIALATDGEQAIAALHANAPDVMLLDLQMPRLNGIEVCMYMRGAHVAPNCEVVLVSAGAQDHDRQLLHQLGIKRFILKGSDLGGRIAEALAHLRDAG